MIGYIFVVLCGLAGSALAKGKVESVPKGKFSVPVLDVKSRQLVLEANQTLTIHCRGRWELSWAFPGGVARDQERMRLEDSRCGRQSQHYCSQLTLSSAQAQHTGSFRCRYSHRTLRQRAVYVYVTDRQRPFVEEQNNSPDVVYMKESQPLVFPCRVTNPDATVSLVKFPDQELTPDQRNIVWNSRQGFLIHSPTYFYIGLFSCKTSVNGTTHSLNYLTHRQVNKIMKVYLNSTSPVHSLQGESLAINCTVTAEWNSRVSISWDYPGQANRSAIVSRWIMASTFHMVFYSILSIPKLHRSDRGLYICRVTSGPVSRETNVSVTVYDRPFIRLKPRQGAEVEAHAGQKSYRLSPKLRAFPAPEVIWLKDGKVAAEECSRYHVDGNSLVIRDVAEEDAGKYTILVGIQEHRLYQNLTLSLVVNVSPGIGEKAVSVQDPGSVPRGSRQALHCTSHGVPPPHIAWLWHPCPPKGLCVCPPSSSMWSPVKERAPGTSTHNHILSVTHRQEVLQGKNKTVGVLMVAEAFVSGVYRCIASSSVGKDELDMPFYITDVPGGFSVSQEDEPREGGDLHLTCVANKHLYSNFSWQRVTDPAEATPPTPSLGGELSSGEATPPTPSLGGKLSSGEATPSTPSLGGELSSGEFSDTLSLLLSNLTAGDSGTYRCSANHLLTGQNTHLDTQVDVTVLEAPVLLQNLSDCSVNISSSVTLSCRAHGVPRPFITWYKDQHTLLQGSGIVIAQGGENLHIDRITVEDQGLYTCQATNERGSAESSAYIWVHNSSGGLSLEIPTLTCTCLVATLFWLLLTLFIRKLKKPNSSSAKAEYLSIILDPGEGPLEEQCDRLQYDPGQWEFPRDRLKLEKPLGRGAFGKVMQASAFGIDNSTGCRTVAVKMLKEGATPSDHKALMTELKILNHIGHHLNVVNLLGACTKAGPLMVIVEYCRYGNLSTYLKSKRDVFLLNKDGKKRCFEEREGTEERGVSKSPLFLEDLISFSFQVSRGMEFLASRKCIHRDLAARNILLSENKVVKICDFGLARDLYKDLDYVRKGDARLPLKWMSPESIFDKVFTTQSDVWSYGVLLWEIFSLGASPYPGLNIDEEFCHQLKEGTRMRSPEYSTPEIYSTMLACWEANPSDRPTFTGLVETLGDLLEARVQQDGKDYIPLGTFLCGERDPDSSVQRDSTESSLTDLHPHRLISLGYMNTRSTVTLRTFEELPSKDPPGLDDEQGDSGMVLPSEELKRLKWTSGAKSLTRSFTISTCRENLVPCMCNDITGVHDDEPPVLPCDCDSEESCSPPPDYNSAFLYPSL
ncbi:vascular endothelial growth factor receptor 1-like isoform X1 [Oncorhynchus clarkii lewisi]|uniref:vascular endothelial growth factor receptor 1-like isoform X1 n=1 Tax=Oncorhynchus clarkii lewisi TaxID=490388 RepID=UPI0039B99341